MAGPPVRRRAAGPLTDEAARRRQRRAALDVKLSPYLYISPFFLLFALVGLFPLVYTGLRLAPRLEPDQRQGRRSSASRNYLDVLPQPQFSDALRNTFSIFLLSSVPQMILAIVIAAVLDATCAPRPSGGWACCCPTSWPRSPWP